MSSDIVTPPSADANTLLRAWQRPGIGSRSGWITATLLAALATAFAAPALAQTAYISNVGQDGDVAYTISANGYVGVAFTTGSESGGYPLGSVGIVPSLGYTSTTGLAVKIYSVNASGNPDSVVYTMTNPTDLSSGTEANFPAPTNASLSANTSYIVTIETTSDSYAITRTSSANEDSGGATGWSMGDMRHFWGGSVWALSTSSHVPKVAIYPPATTTTSTDATLSDLELTDTDDIDIALTPTFASDTDTYTASVANGISEINVTPTTNDSNATVEYLDSADSAITDADTMETGQQVALAVGANTIKVKVTAEDDNTTETYTVTVTRAAATATDTILVQNLGRSDNGTVAVGGTGGFRSAQEFTVGPNNDSALSDVTIRMNSTGGGVSVAIHEPHTNNDSNPAGSSLYDLTTPSGTGTGNRVFTAPADSILERGKSYFVVVTGPSDERTLDITNANDETGLTGWEIENDRRARISGSWTSANSALKMRLRGGVIISPNNAATGTPEIAGTAEMGATLTASAGSIDDDDDLPTTTFPTGYSFQWVRVDSDGVSNPVDVGTDSQTYVPRASDVGKRILVEVTFTDGGGTEETRPSDAFPSTGTVTCASTAVWCGALTVRSLSGGHRGCTGTGANSCSDTDILSEDAFNHDATDYAITTVQVRADGELRLFVDTDLTTASEMLVLQVGSESFAFEDADTQQNRNRRWSNSGLTWAAGDVVDLVLGEAPDATLSGLTLTDTDATNVALTPRFASDRANYTASVAHAISEITVAPETTDANATVEYFDENDTLITDSNTVTGGHQIALAVGSNTIKVNVTAADSTTGVSFTETYRVTVVRPEALLVGNLGQSRSSAAELGGGGNQRAAQKFNVPAGSDYTLTDITVVMFATGQASDVSLSIREPSSGDADRPGNSDLYTFTAAESLSRRGAKVFLAEERAVLEGGESYFVHASGLAGSGRQIDFTTSDAEDSDSLAGWTMDNTTVFRIDSGSGWTVENVAMHMRLGGLEGVIASTDATLSDLELADSDDIDITLTPAFASDTTIYTASVATAISEITVTPTFNDDYATVEYLDSSDAAIDDADSVEDGQQVALAPGVNTIKVKVTAEDGDTTETYTVSVTRATPPTSELVSSLGQLSNGFVSLANDPSVTVAQKFTVGPHVDYLLTEVTISLITDMSGEVDLSIHEADSVDNDNPASDSLYDLLRPSGTGMGERIFTAPAEATLAQGTSYFLVLSAPARRDVTTTNIADETGIEGWTIADVGRGLDDMGSWADLANNSVVSMRLTGYADATTATDAVLSDLKLTDSADTEITLTPTFASDTTSYAASVAHAISEITVTPATRDSNATVEYLDDSDVAIDDADSGTEGHQVALAEGDNTIKVKVTAGDELTTETYTVTVAREMSSVLVNTLGQTNDGNFLIGGAGAKKGAQKFTVEPDRDYTLTEVTINLTAAGGGVDVSIHEEDANNTNNPADSSLHDLIRPSGSASGNRTFRAPPDATLERGKSYFVVASGPSGNDRELSYTDSDNQTGESGWTVADDARTQNSGTWSNQTSTVRMRLRGLLIPISTDATLSDVALTDTADTPIDLAPTFAAATTSYTAVVANAVTQINVAPSTSHGFATFEILDSSDAAIEDADTVTDGLQVSLNEGRNTIRVKVTAEDTVTTQTYSVTVTRDASGSASTLVSNLAQPQHGQFTLSDGANGIRMATKFTVGPDKDYMLSNVTINLPTAGGGASVAVHEEDETDSTNPASTSLYDLITPSATNLGNRTYRAPAGASLERGKSYFVVVTGPGAAQSLNYTEDTAESGEAGWSIADGSREWFVDTFAASPGIIRMEIKGKAFALPNAATGKPAISGTPQVDQTLSAQMGDIADPDDLPSTTFPDGYSFQWIRVDADGLSNPVEIGTDSETYVQVASDVGKRILVEVSFTDGGGVEETVSSDAYPSTGTVTCAADAVWCAALDVQSLSGGVLGCSESGGTACSNASNLTENEFNHDSTDYNVSTVQLQTNGELRLFLDIDLTAATQLLVFHVGDESFAFEDADVKNNRNRRWSNSGLSWAAGDIVDLKLAESVASTDATLSDLELTDSSDDSDIILTPAFASDTTAYIVSTGNEVSEVTLDPTANHDGATVEYLDDTDTAIADADSVDDGHQVALSVGSNTIKVKVTAADGVATETYTLTVTRTTSPTLVSSLSQANDSSTGVGGNSNTRTAQKFTVGPDRDYTLTDVAVAVGDGAGVNISIHEPDANDTANPADASLYDLTAPAGTAEGDRIFTAPADAVLARGQSYFVFITGPSGDATTLSLTTSNAQTGETGWTIGNNRLWRSTGTWSISNNAVRMRITGELVPLSTDATLSGLALSDTDATDIGLMPTFASDTTAYTASVANAISEINVTPTTNDDGATVEYFDSTDTAIADADAVDDGQQVALAVGANTIKVKVTAEDGGTTETYTVTVTRTADAFWSTKLTIGADSGNRGVSVTSGWGSLDDDDFEYLSSTRMVEVVLAGASGVVFRTNRGGATFGGLVLEWAEETLPLDDASRSGHIFTWSQTWLDANAPSLNAATFATTLPENAIGTVCLRTATQVCPSTAVTAPNATGKPGISGSPQVDETLTADAGDIADADDLPTTTFPDGYSFQWVRVDSDGMSNPVDIGTDSDNYTPDADDVGKRILVEVSFTDGGGTDEKVTSDAYPSRGTVAAALPACPAEADWCALMTVGYNLTTISGTEIEVTGYNTNNNSGALDPAMFSYGGTDYSVVSVLRATTESSLGDVLSDALSFRLSTETLPDGTVVQLDATTFTVGTGTETTTVGQEQWDLADLGISPDWAEGQKVRVSANLPPGLSTATVDGTSLVLTYGEALDTSSVPAAGDYKVKVDGGTETAPSSVAVSGSTVTLTLATAVTSAQTVTVSYTVPASNPLKDESGLEADALTDQTVTRATDTSMDVVLVSNDGQTSASGGSAIGATWHQWAQGFTTGSQATTLSSVTLSEVFNIDSGDAIIVSLWSESGGIPDSSVQTLTAPSLASNMAATFTVPAGATVSLAASTTYFVHIQHSTGNGISVKRATDNTVDASSLTGWTLADEYHAISGGTTTFSTSSEFSGTFKLTLRGSIGATTASTDATLSDLELSDSSGNAIALSHTFASDTTAYTAAVVNASSEITVDPTTNDDGATVEYLDSSDATITDADSVEDGQQVALAVGSNTIKVKVTAEDDNTTETYTLTVFRNIATDPVLVSNLEEGNNYVDVSRSEPVAQRFNTGTNTAGYTLTSAVIRYVDPQGDSFSAKVCTVMGSDQPTSTCTDLSPPPVFPQITSGVSPENLIFTVPAGMPLEAGTRYTLVLTPDSDAVVLTGTANDGEDSKLNGWNIAGEFRDEAGGDWNAPTGALSSRALRVRINGTVTAAATDATLSDLELTDSNAADVALTPAFASDTAAYTASVANTISEITVNPTTNDSNATVEYLDSSDAAIADADLVDDGQQVALAEGANTIKVKVTAEDDNTTETYTVTVTRAISTNIVLVTNLSERNDAGGAVGGSTDVRVAQEFTVGPNSDYTLDDVTIFFGGAGAASMAIHEPSTGDADNPKGSSLHDLTAPGGTGSGNRTFTAPANATLTKGQSYFVVVSGPSGNAPSLTFTDATGESGQTGWEIADARRRKTSGTSWEAATRVMRMQLRGEAIISIDATLSDLELSDTDATDITLTPVFAADTTAYTASVANGISEINVNPTTNDGNATVEYLDDTDTAIADADDMEPGQQVALTEGANTIKVKVTAEDGSSTETYTVTVTRATPAFWSTKLTIGADSGNRGVSVTSGWGSLDDDDFEYLSSTRMVEVVLAGASGVVFRTNRGGGTFGGLVLEWAEETLPLDDASRSGHIFTWSQTWLDANAPSLNAANFASTLPENGFGTVCLRTAAQTCPSTVVTAPDATGKPGISGSPQVDETLTADAGDIADDDDLPTTTFPDGYTFQWMRVDSDGMSNPVDIGTDSSTYTPVADDVGKRILVEVTFTDGVGVEETLISDAYPSDGYPTAVIAPALTACPTVNDWCEELTVGRYIITGIHSSYGFNEISADFEEPGILDDTTIEYGDTTYTIQNRIYISEAVSSDGTDAVIIYVDDFLPRGSVFNLGGTEFTADSSAEVPLPDLNAYYYEWSLPAGFGWSVGEKVRVSANLSPGLSTATVDGTSLVLTYGEALDTSSVPAAGDYSVKVDSAAGVEPSSVSVSGSTVTLTLATAVTNGQTVTVSYTVPASNALKDTSGLEAPALTDWAVTNNTGLTANATGRPRVIDGDPYVDRTLTAGTGNIADVDGLTQADNDDAGYAYTYQWIRMSGTTEVEIAGATDSTYTLAADDEGTEVRVRVSFTDDADNDESRTSVDYPNHGTIGPAVTPVTLSDDALVLASNINQSHSFNTGLGGSTPWRVGLKFTVRAGTDYTLQKVRVRTFGTNRGMWAAIHAEDSGNSNNPAGSYVYPLVRTSTATTGIVTYAPPANAVLTGGTNYFIVLNGPHASRQLRVTNANGDDDVTLSGWTIADERRHRAVGVWAGNTRVPLIELTGVSDATGNATGAPAITGDTTVGQTLTAAKGTTADAEGLTKADNGDTGFAYTYQWIRVDGANEDDIAGATDSTYVLADADDGKNVKVRMSFRDDAGTSESVTSASYPSAGTVGCLEGVLWCATLNVKDLSGNLGCANDSTGNACTNTDNLTEDEFTYDSTDYSITSVQVLSSGQLRLVVSPDFTNATLPLVLNVGSDSFLSTDADEQNADNLRWNNSGLSWSVGDAIALSLTKADASTDATLSGLEFTDPTDDTDIALTPAFSTSVTTYTATVENDVSEMTLGPTSNDDGASFEYLDGTDTAIPDADDMEDGHQVALSEGTNTIKVKVTAEDGMTTQTYTFTVMRAMAANAMGKPAITGPPQVDKVLTAGEGDIEDEDDLPSTTFPDGYTFQWIRVDSSDIEVDITTNGTSSTYTLVADDVGNRLKVRVGFTDGGDTEETLTSDATGTVVAAARACDTDAAWCSTLTVGAANTSFADGFCDSRAGSPCPTNFGSLLDNDFTLDATNYRVDSIRWGVSRGTNTTSYSLHLTLNKDFPERSLGGLTLAVDTVSLELADAVRGNPSDSIDNNYRWPNVSQAFADFTPGVDVTVELHSTAATGQPSITGTARQGETLTAGKGTIDDVDGVSKADNSDTGYAYTYQWVRVDGTDETEITGETSSTYTLVAADVGKTIKVKTSFTDDADNAEGPLTSDEYPSAGSVACAAGVVWCAVLDVNNIGSHRGCSGNGGNSCSDTANLSEDEFNHDSTDYDITTVHVRSNGQLRLFLDPDLTTATQSLVLHVGSDTFAFDDADEKNANNRRWNNSGLSWSAGDLVELKLTESEANAMGKPAITGSPQVDETLTAGAGDIADADNLPSTTFPAGYTFQWIRVDSDGVSNPVDIGTDSEIYVPEAADVGKRILVEVSFTDGGGIEEKVTSDAYPSEGYPADAIAIVAAQPACPTDNNWCATLTLGYDLEEVPGFSVHGSGYFPLSSLGMLDLPMFSHAGTDYTATEIGRTAIVPDPGSSDSPVDKLEFVYTGGALPHGAVLQLDATTFTVTPDTADGTGEEEWNLLDLGISPNWVKDQKVRASLTFPPVLSTATVDGTSLVLTYTEALDTNSVPAASDYAVKVDGGTGTAPSSVAVSDKTVTLTLGTAVTNGQVVTVTYTVPTSNALQGESGLEAIGLTDEPVTNNTDVTNNVPTGKPGISGPAQVGQALTAGIGTIEDMDGKSGTILSGYTFQWIRVDADGSSNPTDVGTSRDYTLQPADVSKKLIVEVTFTDGAGFVETVPSDASSTVVPAAAENCSAEGTVWCETVTVGYSTADGDGYVWLGYGNDVTSANYSFGSLPPASAQFTYAGTQYTVTQVVTHSTSSNLVFATTPDLPTGGLSLHLQTITGERDVPLSDTTLGSHPSFDTNIRNFELTLSGAWRGTASIPLFRGLYSGDLDPYGAPSDEGLQFAIRLSDFSLSSATVDGTELVLTYSKALDENSVPAAGDYSVSVDSGTGAAPSSVAVSDKTVTLTLGTAVTNGQVVTVSYTVPASNALQDTSGFEAVALTNETVSNNTAAVITCTDANVVWCATLTPVSILGVKGCGNSLDVARCDSTSQLSDNDFTYDNTNYEVRILWLRDSANRLEIQVVEDFTAAADDLTLVIDGTPFAFVDADIVVANERRWSNSGLSWTDGTDVEVKLVETGSSTTGNATGKPEISGPPQVDETVTAGAGDIADPDNLPSTTFPDGYTFQWIRVDSSDNEANITTNGTSRTYTPVAADVGNRLKVKVTFTDGGGTSESLTSEAYPSRGYPPASIAVVDAKTACPAGNDWCGEIEVGAAPDTISLYGYAADLPLGSIGDGSFDVDGTTYDIASITIIETNTASVAVDLDTFVPRGTVFNIGGTEFTADASSESTFPDDIYLWSVPSGFAMVEGQKMVVSATFPDAAITEPALVSNLGQSGSVASTSGALRAQAFTTGSHISGYGLDSIDFDSNSGKRFTAEVWSTDANSQPDTLLYTLTPPATFADAILAFTPPAGTILEARTTYTVVLESVSVDANLVVTTSDGEDAESAPGWSIFDSHHRLSGRLWDEGPLGHAFRIAVRGSELSNRTPEFADATATRSLDETVGGAVAAGSLNIGAPLSATDVEGDALTYTLEGPDAAKFDFDASSGQLQTRPGEAYDYEARTSYSVTMRANDGTSTGAVAVTVEIVDNTNEQPLRPDAPEVVPTPGDPTGIDVSWTAPDNTGRPAITGYDVQYRKPTGSTWTDGPQNVTGTSTSITGLDAGSEYQARVRAQNRDGDGEWSSVGGAGGGTGVTIRFGASSYSAFEGGYVAQVAVVLNRAPEETVTIPLTRTPRGGATAADYSGVPSSLTFGPNRTSHSFDVTAVDDAIEEFGESLRIAFGSLPASVMEGSRPFTDVELVDNDGDVDARVGFVSDGILNASEGGEALTLSAQVVLKLDRALDRSVTVPITTTHLGGATAADYRGVPSSVTFAAGETEA